MKDSAGKRVARDLFYKECLPKWLSNEQLLSGNFLLLLGKEALELPYTDALGIPRSNIRGIEHRDDYYLHLRDQNLGVHLSRKDIGEFLRRSLHRDHRFQVLNLDICGEYRKHLDPAMSSVLLYCGRNPHTVVGTYHAIGRDEHTVWEGAKSLLLFMWLLPEETNNLASKLMWFYAKGGYDNPLKCMLRDMFWLRSVMEHTMITSSPLVNRGIRWRQHYFGQSDQLWSLIQNSANRSLRMDHLHKAAETFVNSNGYSNTEEELPLMHIVLADQAHVVYKANWPWCIRAYYTKFSLSAEPVPLKTWIAQAFKVFGSQPFAFISREGKLTRLASEDAEPVQIPARAQIEDGRGMYKKFKPRSPSIGVSYKEMASIQRIFLELEIKRKRKKMMAKKKRDKELALVKRGKLTALGVEQVKELAGQGLNTQEILEELKLDERKTPVQSIVAHTAIARRVKRFVEDGNGRLSDYGKDFIRSLAKRNVPLEDVLTRVPDVVSARSVGAVYRAARK